MTKAQKLVAAGSISGILFMLAGLLLLSRQIGALGSAATAGERLAYAAQWNALAIIPLFMAIGSVGNERFRTAAIDPIGGEPSQKMTINNRVVDNTLQQFALFATATFAIAAGTSGEQLGIIGAAAIVFAILRLAFWVGYRIDPLYRAFGMGGTMYLNLVLLGYAAWLA